MKYLKFHLLTNTEWQLVVIYIVRHIWIFLKMFMCMFLWGGLQLYDRVQLS